VQKHLADHDMHEKHYAARPGGSTPDLKWQLECSKPAVSFTKIVAAAVYGKRYDGPIKNGLKNRKVCEEIWAYKDFEEELGSVLEELKAEKEAAEKAKKEAEDREKQNQEGGAGGSTAVGGTGAAAASGDTEAEDPFKSFKEHCHRTVRSTCTLLAEPRSETQLAEAIKGTEVFNVASKQGPGNIAILWDVKLSGESTWQPNVRVCNFREDSFEKLTRGAMRAFCLEDVSDDAVPLEMKGNQLWSFWDGWKHGLVNQLLKPFKVGAGPKAKLDGKDRTLYLPYDPKSLADRRAGVWDSKKKTLVEWCIQVTAEEHEIAEASYDIYPHLTTSMDMLGPIVMDTTSSDATWRMPFGSKKKLYGAGGARTPPGTNANHASAAGPKGQDKRTDAKIEPVFYMSLPAGFYRSYFKANNVVAVCNLTAGEGHAELACMELGIPCTSICHTEFHATELYTRLEEKAWKRMQEQDSGRLYEKRLKALIQKGEEAKESEQPAKKPKIESKEDKEKETEKKPKKKETKKKKKAKRRRDPRRALLRRLPTRIHDDGKVACCAACNARMYTHVCTYVHTYTYIHMHICIHACIHAQMHTCTHIHTYIHSRTDIHIHTYHCQKHAHTYVHICIHAHTHVHTYIHART